MDRYIGLDAHASSCTVAIVGPSGRHLASHVVETNARALISTIEAIPRQRRLCLEEGALAGWLHEVLAPHVQEIVVTAAPKNRGSKSDKHDAFALAEMLRIGAIPNRVYKQRGRFTRLAYLAKAYQALVGDDVRVQNRIKSLLRSRGVQVAGSAVYTASGRSAYLDQLPAEARALADVLYQPIHGLQPGFDLRGIEIRPDSGSAAAAACPCPARGASVIGDSTRRTPSAPAADDAHRV